MSDPLIDAKAFQEALPTGPDDEFNAYHLDEGNLRHFLARYLRYAKAPIAEQPVELSPKHCPFCGPGQSMVDYYLDDYGYHQVACGRCGSHSGHVPKGDPNGKARVIALWNRRPMERESGGGWQPIETAPRDTLIDTFGVFVRKRSGGKPVGMRLCDDFITSNTPYPLVKTYHELEGATGNYTRTHWMLPPENPKTDIEGQKP